MRLKAQSQGRAILPVAEPHAPGWKAQTDDGVSLKMMPVNIAQRAIVLPGGSLYVSMWYAPFSYRIGAFIFLLSWSALAVAWGARHVKRVTAPLSHAA